jgi:uncharacterized membrane protein
MLLCLLVLLLLLEARRHAAREVQHARGRRASCGAGYHRRLREHDRRCAQL